METKTDRELLELAAKACGVSGEYTPIKQVTAGSESLKFCAIRTKDGFLWNPLVDEGQLYKLARDYGMKIDFLNKLAFSPPDQSGAVKSVHWTNESDESFALVSLAARIGPLQRRFIY